MRRISLFAVVGLAALFAGCASGQAEYERGVELREQGDLTAAIVAFSDAIASNDEFALAYNDRGELYRSMGRFELALADFDRAIASDDTLPSAFSNRAEIRLLQGDSLGAVADADRAIAIGPAGTRCPRIVHGAPTRATCSLSALAIGHQVRGLAYLDLGDTDAALIDLDRAVLLDKDFPEAFAARARTRLATDDLVRALADANEAIRLAPALAVAYRTRGEIHDRLGEANEAQADFAQAETLAADG